MQKLKKLNLNTCTNLLQPLEVLPEEGHGPVWPRGAQLHNAVLQQLLNVVFLHILLTLPQAPLLLAARTSRCHGDNRNPALWPLTFVLGKADSSVEKKQAWCQIISVRHGFTFWPESSTKTRVSVCRDEIWPDRKCENVRKTEPEWECAERWGVALTPWSLSASECQEQNLVIWWDHT